MHFDNKLSKSASKREKSSPSQNSSFALQFHNFRSRYTHTADWTQQHTQTPSQEQRKLRNKETKQATDASKTKNGAKFFNHGKADWHKESITKGHACAAHWPVSIKFIAIKTWFILNICILFFIFPRWFTAAVLQQMCCVW